MKGGIYKLVKDLILEPIKSSVLRVSEGSIRQFQRKIYQKAKQEKEYRFYSLIDKVVRIDFLEEAYRRVKEKDGSPGIDNETFEEIEKKGLGEYLEKLSKEIKGEIYKPSPVKRVYIEKANGKLRPLGIPTIRDRIAQMSCKIVIEPIFEARFEENSHGFRPKRSAKGAIKEIHSKILTERKKEVYDGDISKYFDNIIHEPLLKLINREITDRKILRLIKLWLTTPVMEEGKLMKSLKGTPQGGVISPLLANIYLNELIKEVNREGSIFQKRKITIVTYADDFVLLGTRIGKEVIEELRRLLKIMGLELNEEKSKLINVFEGRFKFLGFEIGYEEIKDRKGKHYLRISPSTDAIKKVKAKVKTVIDKKRSMPAIIIAGELNDIIRGWFNYFRIEILSNMKDAQSKLNWYLDEKLYKLYKKKKSQKQSKLCKQGVYKVYKERYGLISPYAL